MDEATDSGGIFAGDRGRRDALKKLGVGAVGAAAAWVAPNVLSVAAAATGTVPPPPGCIGCGSDRIVNGSFETTTGGGPLFVPVDWIVTGIGFSYLYANLAVIPPVGAGAHTGGAANGGSLAQTFAIDAACAGHGFLFQSQAWALNLDGDIHIAFADGSGGANDVHIAVPQGATSVYAAYNASGTIPTGTTDVTVTFSASTPNGELGFDLVSFVIGC